MKKYTINELVSILGISRTAVNRKIEKYKFDTVQEYVNGVLNKLISITDEQLEALQLEVQKNKGVNTVSQHSYDTKLNKETSETVENNTNNNEMFKTMLTQLQHYADTAIEAERSKTLLLEDKSRQNKGDAEFYKNENLKVTHEYNSYKTRSTQQKTILYVIIAILLFVTVLSVCYTCYTVKHPKTVIQEKQTTKIITVDNQGKVKSILTK